MAVERDAGLRIEPDLGCFAGHPELEPEGFCEAAMRTRATGSLGGFAETYRFHIKWEIL